MNKIQYIKSKYNIPQETKGEIRLPISRWKEWPLLLNELEVKISVEVGTYKGKFAECLCDKMPSVDLTVVDKWEAYKGYKDFEAHDLETIAYNQTVERSKTCGFKIIKEWSLDAVEMFADESLDFIFIDGNHAFRHVVDDIDSWYPKLRANGIIASHDFYRNRYKKFGVREAVPAYLDYLAIDTYFVVAGDKCPSVFWIKP
jgi:hypothetical protein